MDLSLDPENLVPIGPVISDFFTSVLALGFVGACVLGCVNTSMRSDGAPNASWDRVC